jgi:hypothetical protein
MNRRCVAPGVHLAPFLLAGCGSGDLPTAGQAPVGEARFASVGGSPATATESHECPTKGTGSIQLGDGVTCLTMTPAETGASASGTNANVAEYALYPGPGTATNGQLLLYMNGTGSTPAASIASPPVNIYNTAVSLGYAVLAVAYRSDQQVLGLCGTDDACFYPTRQTLILGVFQPGAAAALADPNKGIRLDEGIADRAVLALQWLVQHDPSHPWASFLSGSSGDPALQIAWSSVVAAGHSQGGGHATAIGNMFDTSRVLQLSAPCENVNGAPATWLDVSSRPWATPPGTYFGLDTTQDTTCFTFALAWQALGMAPPRANSGGATCGQVSNPHYASILCPANASNWEAMLQ